MRNCKAALLALVALGCQADGTGSDGAFSPGLDGNIERGVGRGGPAIVSLADSIEPLRAEFNRRANQPRLVALLSSTEGPCALGARAVRESVLESYPDADLWVAIVWVDMQPSDSERSVALAARRFVDRRVEHFHDPDKHAGRAFATGLLPIGVVWDVYLFYPPGREWDEEPPRPLTWAHQLGRIDPEHFHPREMLFQRLHASTAELLSHEEPETSRGALRAAPPESTRWAGLEPGRD